jgi:hypothetical protein
MRIILLFCCFSVFYVYSQKQINQQQLIWFGYFQTIQFSEKWSLTTDVQERFFVFPKAQHQLILRSGLNYKLPVPTWVVQIGGCVFFQQPNEPEITQRLTIPELRPHIQLTQSNKQGKKFKVEHRYRLESRFFHNTNETRTELTDGFQFRNFRMRYRFLTQYSLYEKENKPSFGLKIYDEIHVNFGEKIVTNVFDHNRFFVGCYTQLTKNIGLDFGYLNWFQQRENGQFYNRHIFRLNLNHRMDFRKDR